MKEIVLDGIVTAATDWVPAHAKPGQSWSVRISLSAGAEGNLAFVVGTETVRQISVGSEVEIVIRSKVKP